MYEVLIETHGLIKGQLIDCPIEAASILLEQGVLKKVEQKKTKK